VLLVLVVDMAHKVRWGSEVIYLLIEVQVLDDKAISRYYTMFW
jgi:hypothetical protein